MPYEYQEVKLSWLGHDGFRLRNSHVVYIDPYKLAGSSYVPADVLLVTHNHFDHLSLPDIKKVVSRDTLVVAARECQGKFGGVTVKEIKTVNPGDKLTVHDIAVEAVPAYNLNKSFHPKQDGKVGFVVQMGKVRVYHTGDSDHIPEMAQIRADVALLPVSGTYVMTAEEAAEAAKSLRPKLAIPMHYGTIIGSEADARRFEQLAKAVCEVKILQPEQD